MDKTLTERLYTVAIALGQIWDGLICLLTLTLYWPCTSVTLIEKKIRHGIKYRKAQRDKSLAK